MRDLEDYFDDIQRDIDPHLDKIAEIMWGECPPGAISARREWMKCRQMLDDHLFKLIEQVAAERMEWDISSAEEYKAEWNE